MLKYYATTFILLLLINSCSSEFEPAKFKVTSIDTIFEAEISATFHKATGNNKLSKTINSNVENSIINTIIISEKTSDLNTVLKNFNSEFVNFKNDFPEASNPIWELYIETELLYQSEEIITLAISTYEFQGGAHGNDKIKFLNINAQSGNVLNPYYDIITDSDAFKALAEKYFIAFLNTKKEGLIMEDFFFGKPFQLPENIGFTENGIVLLYNVYEIASYNQGYTELTIPFKDARPFLKLN